MRDKVGAANPTRENGRDEQLFSLGEMSSCYRLLHHHSSRHNRREWRVGWPTRPSFPTFFLPLYFLFDLIFIYKRDTHTNVCVCLSMSLLRDQQHVKTRNKWQRDMGGQITPHKKMKIIFFFPFLKRKRTILCDLMSDNRM